MSEAPLAQLAVDFSILSLLAVGGAVTVLPEMHRSVVEVHGWMSGAQFADLFALAQASPGPNILVVSLIGWKVAGLAGALVATAAVCGPSCLLTFGVSQIWRRFRHAPWRVAVEAGLVPVTVGLMLILIGFLLLPLFIAALILVPILDLVVVIIAAVKVSNGEFYRYPFTLKLIT